MCPLKRHATHYDVVVPVTYITPPTLLICIMQDKVIYTSALTVPPLLLLLLPWVLLCDWNER